MRKRSNKIPQRAPDVSDENRSHQIHELFQMASNQLMQISQNSKNTRDFFSDISQHTPSQPHQAFNNMDNLQSSSENFQDSLKNLDKVAQKQSSFQENLSVAEEQLINQQENADVAPMQQITYFKMSQFQYQQYLSSSPLEHISQDLEKLKESEIQSLHQQFSQNTSFPDYQEQISSENHLFIDQHADTLLFQFNDQVAALKIFNSTPLRQYCIIILLFFANAQFFNNFEDVVIVFKNKLLLNSIQKLETHFKNSTLFNPKYRGFGNDDLLIPLLLSFKKFRVQIKFMRKFVINNKSFGSENIEIFYDSQYFENLSVEPVVKAVKAELQEEHDNSSMDLLYSQQFSMDSSLNKEQVFKIRKQGLLRKKPLLMKVVNSVVVNQVKEVSDTTDKDLQLSQVNDQDSIEDILDQGKDKERSSKDQKVVNKIEQKKQVQETQKQTAQQDAMICNKQMMDEKPAYFKISIQFDAQMTDNYLRQIQDLINDQAQKIIQFSYSTSELK